MAIQTASTGAVTNLLRDEPLHKSVNGLATRFRAISIETGPAAASGLKFSATNELFDSFEIGKKELAVVASNISYPCCPASAPDGDGGVGR